MLKSAAVLRQARACNAATVPLVRRFVPPEARRGKAPAHIPGKWKVPRAVEVPLDITRPSYANHPKGKPRPLRDDEFAERKSPEVVERMRRSCGLAAEALALAREVAEEGVTTDEVDRKVSEFILSRGGYPVGINFHGFPRGLCASPNEVALHGIPNTRPLESGDIVNFDVTVYLGGTFGDCSAMVCIGEVDSEARRLVEVTQRCLSGSLALVGPGAKLNAVGEFCHAFAAEHGFGVVREYCGHFIGAELHMRPFVYHTPNPDALELRPGMTFTIEPILIEGGSAEVILDETDGWTIVSQNGGWSAQWEHTVLITEHGAEPLTVPL